MADKRVVLAIFDSEPAADAAVASLKSTELAKGDAIGVLVLDADGALKTEKVAPTARARAPGSGCCLDCWGRSGSARALSEAGCSAGSITRGLGWDESDRDRIADELANGKAAVGVLADEEHAAEITAHLTAQGGQPEEHAVSDEALQEASAAGAST